MKQKIGSQGPSPRPLHLHRVGASALFGLALLLAAASLSGCQGALGIPFEGSFFGTTESSYWELASGAPLGTESEELRIRIRRDADAQLYLDGACAFPLEATSDEHAYFLESVCAGTSAEGLAVRTDVEGGELHLARSYLQGQLEGRLSYAAGPEVGVGAPSIGFRITFEMRRVPSDEAAP